MINTETEKHKSRPSTPRTEDTYVFVEGLIRRDRRDRVRETPELQYFTPLGMQDYREGKFKLVK
jgi:hypothetical protein